MNLFSAISQPFTQKLGQIYTLLKLRHRLTELVIGYQIRYRNALVALFNPATTTPPKSYTKPKTERY